MSNIGKVVTLREVAVAAAGARSATVDIVEMMNKACPLLDDMHFQNGNLPTGHLFKVRASLPGVYWRRLNEGVKATRSTVTQVTETCGMLEAVSDLDAKEVDLADDRSLFRLQESYAFIEAMTQEFSNAVWYGDEGVKPEAITGLAKRFSSLTGPVSSQIIDAGGTANANASIWLVVWSPLTTFGIVPKNSRAGLIHDASEKIDITDFENQGTYKGYRDRFQWDVGLCLRDHRYVGRIANIDVDKLDTFGTASDQAADLIGLMNRITNRIQNLTMGRAVFYMNRRVKEAWENQLLKSQYIQHTVDTATGKWQESYKMIPIKVDDSLLETEERVV